MKKRFLGILSIIMALCICTAISASAQAPGGDVARPQTVYTGVSGTISNYYAELTCTLNKTLEPGYVEAYVQSSSNSGTVECYIKRPNGTIDFVGLTAASGGSTGAATIHNMVPGNYTFIFQASTPATLRVNAVVRD